jgi:endonuclease/exonuclease/phosphatase family metal-dependent hydrolase
LKKLQICLIFFTSVLCSSFVFSKETNIRIGTFNIEWLGDGNNDNLQRSSKDYMAIAHIINSIDCDVLALQEIENQNALNSILTFVQSKYDFFIDSTTLNNLKVVILYKRSFQKIDAQYIQFSKNTLKHERPALYLKLSRNNKEFEFISLHLKSSSRKNKDDKNYKENSSKIRKQQAEELTTWMKKHSKRHSILMGDFNEEYDKGEILKAFEKEFNSKVISKNLVSCANRKWKMIDHIILPEHFAKDFKPERVQLFNHNLLSSAKNAPKISDHCLVYYTLTLKK